MLGYAAFALLAVFTLEGKYLAFILILMAGLALKSWIAAKRDKPS
jgi:chromate transport protein ChrA